MNQGLFYLTVVVDLQMTQLLLSVPSSLCPRRRSGLFSPRLLGSSEIIPSRNEKGSGISMRMGLPRQP